MTLHERAPAPTTPPPIAAVERAQHRGKRQLKYTPLERLDLARPVDRIEFIARACVGCQVLDLGAMDETAWAAKRGRGSWLHEEIGFSALAVDGIDNSALVPTQGLCTGPNATIRRGDITDLDLLVAALATTPDVVVIGELIEHLENPLQFLKHLAAIERLAGKSLILSTPNATALHNVLVGLAQRESTHQDHLCIFSYKTLATLCTRAGFREWEIIPYYASFTEMQARHSGVIRLAVRATQRLVNLFEWLFPLLSFGYIVRIRL
jgi:Methyltransferase domain